LIDAEKKAYPITLMCQVLGVRRSSYYAWKQRQPSKRQQEYQRLIPIAQRADKESKGTYGARRIAQEIRKTGVPCGRTKAATVMDLAKIKARQKKKFKVTTDSQHNLPVSPNLLDREFTVSEPNRVYAGDITYIWTQEGWLYLAVVLDLFSRQVVGWSMSRRMTKDLVEDALTMAYWRRKPAPGVIFHSDRGSQYCSQAFQALLQTCQMISSMSRKGDCWDNAVAESFFGSLKTERVFLTHYRTREDARRDIADYIEMFYNSRRLHSHLGYLSPREFERMMAMKKVA
jgi:putative transposase